LASVTIGSGVASIGNNAFNCANLTQIMVSSANTSFSSQSGVLFNKDKTTLIYYPLGKSGSYIIPVGVTTIGGNAFTSRSKLTNLTISNTVTAIPDSAFSNCTGLTGVTIGSGVTTIGTSAFYGCAKLTSVTIPNSATLIGDSAFYGCSLMATVSIPSSVTSIGTNAFRETDLPL